MNEEKKDASNNSVLEELIEKIAEITKIDPSTINKDSNLRQTVKSLEMSQIISSFEEKYDCFIKYTDLMHAETLGDAAEIIGKNL